MPDKRSFKKRSHPRNTAVIAGLLLFFCCFTVSAFAFTLLKVYTSPDNKIKLIVPASAVLSSQVQPLIVPVQLSQRILINVQSLASVSSAAPKGMAVLCAAEFKPDGLKFSTPAMLSITLPQAEVPGSTIQLGLYDSSKKQFVPTGQTAKVGKDGYTVGFQITHFSSYAAMRSLSAISAPIGAGVQVPLPDLLTGSFGHAVALTVPPGRKGIQPALALSYRSSNPNSWVGVGFSLSPGSIVRSTRLGPPSYNDNQDTFYFITDAGTTELVHLVDNLYQAKVESSFAKFFKEADDSWQVLGKDGSSFIFGGTSDARELGGGGTFAWYVTKALDTNGNYLTYQYAKYDGKAYLSRIDYAGNENGTAATHHVEFTLEDRDDVSSSCLSGAKIATAKRLKRVEVYISSDLVWRYELVYGASADTGRSFLKSITQCAADGACFPSQAFTYQTAKE